MGVSASRAVYAYDAQNDFLTQVDYNDGQAGELQDWTYDPAGNRASASANPGSWSYDNLNRIVTSPFGSYTHDLAGNRLTGPGQTMSWDVTNRLSGLNGVTHRYRADGMRVQKVAANGDTYRWHYDAQMPVEETRIVGGQTTVMKNIVGPRGIDVQFDGVNAAFPLYDTHGNAKALLARSGSTFTTTAWRQYDVWGSLRTGSALGGASQRYCANLGHVTDDESGLIYMRARFYEPWTGRFVSQDPAMDGANWFVYCRNSPANMVDPSGQEAEFDLARHIVSFAFLVGFCASIMKDFTLDGDFKLVASSAKALIDGVMVAYVVASYQRLQGTLKSIQKQFEHAYGKSGTWAGRTVYLAFFTHVVAVATMLHLLGEAF